MADLRKLGKRGAYRLGVLGSPPAAQAGQPARTIRPGYPATVGR